MQHVLISTNKSVLWSPRREEVLAFSAQLFMGRPAECAGGSLSARETLAGRCGLSAEQWHRITTHFLSCYLPAFCLFANAKYIYVARSDLLSTRCPVSLFVFLFIILLLFSSSFSSAFANSSRAVKSLCACSGIFLTEFDNPLRTVHISFT